MLKAWTFKDRDPHVLAQTLRGCPDVGTVDVQKTGSSRGAGSDLVVLERRAAVATPVRNFGSGQGRAGAEKKEPLQLQDAPTSKALALPTGKEVAKKRLKG